ncbi:FHA domain-containing protein [candidate division KSB1 bacterium]|nr:FHA domain-containing protein [candidate division KSB1 bacterium]
MKLICRSGKFKGQTFEIDEGVYRIGRASANNLQILSPYISKFHAEIYARGSHEIILKDLRSTNGTFVGNSRVTAEVPLNHGDIILLGKNETYEVVIEAEPEPATAIGAAKPRKKPPTQRVEKAPAVAGTPEPLPTSAPARDSESDSWFNLMDISSDLGEKIDFSDDAIETGSFAESDVAWPDVVKLKIAHDLYEKLLDGSKRLLSCYDEYQVFESASQIIHPILGFNNGILAFQRQPGVETDFDYYYLNEKNIELAELADELHSQLKGEATAQLIPFKNRFNAALYKALRHNTQVFGYLYLLSDIMHPGFTKNDALAFDQICQLFEAAFGKYLIK